MIYNVVFMALSIPVGFVAMWSVDKFGLRTGVGWKEALFEILVPPRLVAESHWQHFTSRWLGRLHRRRFAISDLFSRAMHRQVNFKHEL